VRLHAAAEIIRMPWPKYGIWLGLSAPRRPFPANLMGQDSIVMGVNKGSYYIVQALGIFSASSPALMESLSLLTTYHARHKSRFLGSLVLMSNNV